jgi:hypothetical protein
MIAGMNHDHQHSMGTRDVDQVSLDSLAFEAGATSSVSRRGAWWPMLLAACFLVGFVGPATGQTADEEEPTVTAGGELELASRYVWRGLELSDGAVAEPFVWASAYGLTVSGWGNMPLEGTNSGVVDEVDATLQYAFTLGKLQIEPGVTAYIYHHQPDVPDTTELLLTLTYPIGPVELSLEHDQDVDAFSGAYFDQLGATWTGKKSAGGFTPAVQLAVGIASAKFNEAYVGPSQAALNFVMADLGVTYESGGAFYARAHVSVLSTVDDAIRNELPSGDLIFGGVVLGAEL